MVRSMKTELIKSALVLVPALGTTFLTGCASSNQAYNGPLSALAFTTVTSPNELVKWTGDKYLYSNLRSIDTYYFQVPYTGYHPGNEQVLGPAATSPTSPEGVGAAPEPYQSETGSYQLIQYRPGMGR